MTMTADVLREKFERGLTYDDYLATGNQTQQERWRQMHQRLALSTRQQALMATFTREVNVLVLSGIWCGDCVRQGPMVQRIADHAPRQMVRVRWFDRDAHPDLQAMVRINGGDRVPVVIFAAEDFEPVCWAGDKLLTRYRIMAQAALGPSCPLPGAPVPQEELDAELADWVDQFERVHLLLRLSARLRQKHGD